MYTRINRPDIAKAICAPKVTILRDAKTYAKVAVQVAAKDGPVGIAYYGHGMTDEEVAREADKHAYMLLVARNEAAWNSFAAVLSEVCDALGIQCVTQ